MGCITTDGREYVVMSDPERLCKNGGIVPNETVKLPRRQYYVDVNHRVCGKFTGVFHSATPIYNRVLAIEEADKVTTSAR